MNAIKSPYPWFGGKSTVAELVWQRFGAVRNYVEPFFGSGATLLCRPSPVVGTETVNDANGWLCNFWRALQADPEAVANYADWPVSELDLHARGDWLFYRDGVAEWVEKLRADPDFYDAKSAGWWVWGLCSWIGAGWNRRKNTDTVGLRSPHLVGRGVNRQLPHLGNAGQGVNRQLPHLGNAGQGVNRQRPHLTHNGQGIVATAKGESLLAYLLQLAERLRGVRVCCGDWTRVCGPTPTVKQGVTAVFLDPPYGVDDRDDCYDDQEDRHVSKAVRDWAIEWQADPRMRIALCGYAGEHVMPDSWECVPWKTGGGYGKQRKSGDNENCRRERIWFSPHCIKELSLFTE